MNIKQQELQWTLKFEQTKVWNRFQILIDNFCLINTKNGLCELSKYSSLNLERQINARLLIF